MAAQCWAKGSEAMSKENWDFAIEMFGQCAKLVPENLMYRQTLRGCETRKYGNNGKGARMSGMKLMSIRGQVKKARLKEDWQAVDHSAEEGLKLNPWDAQLNFDLGDACQTRGFDEVAAFCYRKAVEADPENMDFRRTLALLLEERGEYKEAIQQWQRIYKADPDDGEARSKITQLEARSVMDRGGYEKADSTKDVQEQQEEHIQSAYDLYRPTSRQEAPQEADGPGMSVEADLQRAIRKDPAVVENYLKLGNYYKRQKKLKEAAATLEQALEASGGDHNVREQLEDVQLAQMRENLEIARQRAAKNADDETAKKNINDLRRELVLREIEVLTKRVERHPKESALKFELARRFMQEQKFQQAIPLLQQAKADVRLEVDVAVSLGECFLKVKNLKLARRQFEQALEKADPHEKVDAFKKAHYYMGLLCEKGGEKDEAERHYNEILGVDYEYQDVLKRLERLQGGDD